MATAEARPGGAARRLCAVLGQLRPVAVAAAAEPLNHRPIKRLLVANRGEIAIRVFRAARELGIATIAIYTEDDASALHLRCADEAALLQPTAGAPRLGYLDRAAVLAAAAKTGADAIHPGYGFLSEDADFAFACREAGLRFVGPPPELVSLFGDKVAARRAAESLGIAVPRGPAEPCASPARVRSAMRHLGVDFPIMLKAVHGGGGRGMREVLDDRALDAAFAHCSSEAAALGDGALFFEELLPDSRHVEVQVLGDLHGGCVHLFERDCSVQLRRQKVVEMAPALSLSDELRRQLHASALALANSCKYQSAGTFEFLVSGDRVVFIEGNPRIQVEHTVTEEAVGVDIVQAQLLLASGRRLEELGLAQERLELRAVAIQARVCMARAGTVGAYQEPSGPGVRVDAACFAGYVPPLSYDPLLAKVIASAPLRPAAAAAGGGFELARRRLLRALEDFHIGGSIGTNLPQLRSLVSDEAFVSHKVTTAFFDRYSAERPPSMLRSAGPSGRSQLIDRAFAGAGGDAAPGGSRQPLAVEEAPPGHEWLRAPLQAQVTAVHAVAGDAVVAGQEVAALMAMKMEHGLAAPCDGVVVEVRAALGDVVDEGGCLVLLKLADGAAPGAAAAAAAPELARPRPDLEELLARRRLASDDGRREKDPSFADKVRERRARGQRTARENLEDLTDEGSFVEFGGLLIAQQRRRRPLDDLLLRTPGDGLVMGTATINAGAFGAARARAAVVSYDYTVLAGTQGMANHAKCDRLLELALAQRLPMVWFCEGGGGRPGDTDLGGLHGAALVSKLWAALGKLSGLVPLIGLTTGRCFAGNAAILGCCDVIIATHGSNIGMGGPAMIEGGGLGVVRPEEVGPVETQVANGVIDLLVPDEAAAVAAARKYLSYFQGPLPARDEDCQDQRRLRQLVPENRLRVYDMRPVIAVLTDRGSFLELREHYGIGIITGLARIGGWPLGIIANNPKHLGGAIDGDASLKASRFMKLCDAFGLPILSLCDTPGFMVGVPSEADAAVRKVCGMFLTGASLTVPYFTIVTRKAYGLGAQAMAGGAFMGKNAFSVAWPTGEFGGMGLEGAVKLGFRKELDAAKARGAAEYKALYSKLLDQLYQHGKAINNAMAFELDDVIDPAESRRWILSVLSGQSREVPREWRRRRPCVDAWS